VILYRYERLILEYLRDRVPLDWAATQMNLGTASGLWVAEADGASGGGDGPTTRRWRKERASALAWARPKQTGVAGYSGQEDRRVVGKAVAAYRAALLKNVSAAGWAETERLASRLQSGRKFAPPVEEAVAAYRAALLEKHTQAYPSFPGRRKITTGVALRVLERRASWKKRSQLFVRVGGKRGSGCPSTGLNAKQSGVAAGLEWGLALPDWKSSGGLSLPATGGATHERASRVRQAQGTCMLGHSIKNDGMAAGHVFTENQALSGGGLKSGIRR
jgi:hypothetical protein